MSSVRIASFNLKHDFFLARHNRWRDRRELVRRIILEAGPAIVGVQELMPAMREDLRRLLREYNVFGFGRSRDLGNEESAILVRSADNVVVVPSSGKTGEPGFFRRFPTDLHGLRGGGGEPGPPYPYFQHPF